VVRGNNQVILIRMKRFLFILGLLVGPSLNAGELDAYLTGELAELQLLESPVSLAELEVTYPDGVVRSLVEKRGKVLLVNLWARWCVPCKDEMKDFAALQRDLGDDRFEVVALPMKQRSLRSTRKILKGWDADNLRPYGNDPQTLARVLYDGGMYTETSISFEDGADTRTFDGKAAYPS
jgi:thiol-disulfide isomerase/thioredoxin